MNVKFTTNFERLAKQLSKKYRSLYLDLEELMGSLAENPTQGTPLGQDCYKIRMAISSKGKGKSGSGRVITCVKVIHDSVYLLAIYDKSEKETIYDKELNKILKNEGLK